MAVDYYHFILISGPRAELKDFVHRIALSVARRVAGVTRPEFVPFSFESMYAIAGIKDEVPGDAYDMMKWPLVQRGRTAEVRYTFHTRNVEMHLLIK